MNDRVHRVLDGELDADSLSAEERKLLEAMTEVTREVAAAIRSVPAPDLTDRVMAALPALPAPRPFVSTPARSTIRSGIAWLWRPRALEIAWRPAYGIASALALIVTLSGLNSLWSGTSRASYVEESLSAVVYVQFRLDVAGVSSVALAGSFTGWSPGVHLTEVAPGVWSALVPLRPGVHDYTFVIDDDHWIADPAAPAVDDGFGGLNSRLFLTRPADNA